MKAVHESKIIAQTEVAPGIVRTLFAGQEIARESKPGQFVNVQVSRTTDPLLRRPFSVHAVFPQEGVYSLLYALIGRGTKLLNEIRPGQSVSVVGPLGRPFDLGDDPNAEHIVVAGGCGAAPLHFLCDALCAKWGRERVKVLSGAQSKDAVLCEAEFRAHGVDVSISTDDGSYGCKGLVTELLSIHLSSLGNRKSKIENPKSSIRVYSCGPHTMMREVARICHEAKVACCQVSLENNMACGFGVCTGCVQKIKRAAPGDESGRDWHYERVCADGPVFNAEDILWD